MREQQHKQIAIVFEGDVDYLFVGKFLLVLGQQLMIPVLINPDLLLSQDGCSGRLFVTFTIPLTYTPQL